MNHYKQVVLEFYDNHCETRPLWQIKQGESMCYENRNPNAQIGQTELAKKLDLLHEGSFVIQVAGNLNGYAKCPSIPFMVSNSGNYSQQKETIIQNPSQNIDIAEIKREALENAKVQLQREALQTRIMKVLDYVEQLIIVVPDPKDLAFLFDDDDSNDDETKATIENKSLNMMKSMEEMGEYVDFFKDKFNFK